MDNDLSNLPTKLSYDIVLRALRVHRARSTPDDCMSTQLFLVWSSNAYKAGAKASAEGRQKTGPDHLFCKQAKALLRQYLIPPPVTLHRKASVQCFAIRQALSKDALITERPEGDMRRLNRRYPTISVSATVHPRDELSDKPTSF